MDFHALGRGLIVVGMVIVLVGMVLMFSGKVPWLGRLPGDFLIKRDHFTFYFPLATCLVISLVLTLLFRLFGRR